ncbi:hypothetical protein M0R45_025355 [Rubus argutus]|uniref:DYW domain-containing protein n=1 Tax=Rubus argutus TaxID=59490 RepID=A0AAW1WTS9_RUBAR
MKEVYCIKPRAERFTCMADLYGQAGCLDETKEFIHDKGISHFSSVGKSFLFACGLHKNLELGKWVSEKLLQLEPSVEGPYVLMSNMYSTEAKLVMQDVEEEQGEVFFGQHSEKLAIAYGIISTASGIAVQIMMDFRVCLCGG